MRRSENSRGSREAVVGSFLTGSGWRPSVARTGSGMAPDAQACGLEAVGYSTGKFVCARS